MIFIIITRKSQEEANVRSLGPALRHNTSPFYLDAEAQHIRVYNLNEMPTSIKSDESPIQKIHKENVKIYNVNTNVMKVTDGRDESVIKEYSIIKQ